jgi:hypothetical protein
MPSELAGTGALWLALVAAIVIALTDRHYRERVAGVAPVFLIAIALQCLHFAEEFSTGFQKLFPERLGMAPWTDVFFVAFNMVWLCLWSLAAAAISAGLSLRLASIAVWFLTLAAIGNGIAHPVLAIMAGGYFPGLATSPFLGAAGLVLLRRLILPGTFA